MERHCVAGELLIECLSGLRGREGQTNAGKWINSPGVHYASLMDDVKDHSVMDYWVALWPLVSWWRTLSSRWSAFFLNHKLARIFSTMMTWKLVYFNVLFTSFCNVCLFSASCVISVITLKHFHWKNQEIGIISAFRVECKCWNNCEREKCSSYYLWHHIKSKV